MKSAQQTREEQAQSGAPRRFKRARRYYDPGANPRPRNVAKDLERAKRDGII